MTTPSLSFTPEEVQAAVVELGPQSAMELRIVLLQHRIAHLTEALAVAEAKLAEPVERAEAAE